MNGRDMTTRMTQGFALFELLISLVIWAIGILGISGLLLLSIRSNNSSYLKQLSVQSAYDIVDRMRANRQAAINGQYNVNNLVAQGAPTLPATPSPLCSVSSCNTTQLATFDKWIWLSSDVAKLPNGCASINTTTTGNNTEVTIIIQWDDTPARQKLGTIGSTQQSNDHLVQLSIKTLL